ncbi:MAG: hypothetical protein U0P81_02080 [Holophagaceae bacterium]
MKLKPDPSMPPAEGPLPWQAPVLKKGEIGVVTGNFSGRLFDGAPSARS